MQARINPASPFARKVRIVLRERDLTGQVEEVATSVSPVAPNADLARSNPLIKVPALILDDGVALYDSRVICEYLDALGTAPRLFPATGFPRWKDWILGQRAKIDNGVDALEREQDAWGETFEIGQIGAAGVLGYLDFRFPEIEWRASHPRLARWFEAVAQRPSVRDTTPSA